MTRPGLPSAIVRNHDAAACGERECPPPISTSISPTLTQGLYCGLARWRSARQTVRPRRGRGVYVLAQNVNIVNRQPVLPLQLVQARQNLRLLLGATCPRIPQQHTDNRQQPTDNCNKQRFHQRACVLGPGFVILADSTTSQATPK